MPGRGGTLLGRFRLALLGLLALVVAGALTAIPLGSAVAAAPGAAIVVDANTGKVLYASHADAPRHPASLTKMMTLYLLFEAIESGKTSLNDRITISVHAASQAPSKLGLKPGQTISVRDAILAIVTKSANDIAAAIAEKVDGSESAFAAHMTRKARELGMRRTHYHNASGLPDDRQITTARDLTILARALRDHYPQYYHFFSTPSFVWNGHRIANHNHLLGRVAGVNGIKTGYTRASGFNLVTSVDRDRRKIVAVVIGGATSKARDKRMVELIDAYMPRASSKRTVAAIPGGASADDSMLVAKSDYPVPNLRPDEIADASDASSAGAATATDEPAVLADAAGANAPAAATNDAANLSIADLVAGANSIFALDATTTTASTVQATDEGDTGGDDTADAGPPPPPAGWRIQIAAAPTKNGAEDLLDQALAAGGAVLADASPYTETVTSGSSTLYRARFAGFADKESARAACAYLKKHDFDCLAVAN